MRPLQRAIINEQACIGCLKCLEACPVDAIIGAAKQLHTVLAQECTGCRLCLPPCPVDCITLEEIPVPTWPERQQRAKKTRLRVAARQYRLTVANSIADGASTSLLARKAAVAAAIARIKEKRREP